ncbi:MAG: endonuclease [Muribaculaceae bacterium]|nr:endonuclease [Muribaculaceae bacterium]
MRKNLHYLLLLLVALTGLKAAAAIPNNYYNTALGKSDQELMTALHQKIKGHYRIYYNKLWTRFQTTDCSNNIIIDRYSTTQYTYQTGQCGNYSGVGDCYNREHSVPQSWWGGTTQSTEAADTMYSDLYHIYPVDGWVNAERGNYPFGDCANGTPKGSGKLGTCTHSGYSGKVFEVADEYKGDFARTYFYMVVRYMHQVGTWTQGEGSAVFTNSSFKHLTSWAISQLLEWHRNDPVSALEMNRNEAVYGIQNNRNPFIDHPELAEYLWGDKTGVAWTGSDTPTPILSSPMSGTTINVGTNTGNGVNKVVTVKGVNLTKAFTVSVSGTGFSVSPTSLTAAAVNAGTTVTITYNGTATNATGRLTISSTEVTSNVTLTATYNTGGGGGTEIIETWEGCTATGNYTATSIQGHAFAWNVNNVASSLAMNTAMAR